MIFELDSKHISEFEVICKEYKNNFFKLYDLNSLLNNEYQKVYIYKKEEKIIGFIIIEKTFEILSVLHIYISPEFRRRGLASELIKFISKENDIEKVILEVRTDNNAAIALYREHGFQIIHTRKKYYDNADAYVMEKSVKNE